MAEKGFSYIKHKKTWIFIYFGTGMVSKMLSNFEEMESRSYFYKGAKFLLSG
jgi:hypothetical protein